MLKNKRILFAILGSMDVQDSLSGLPMFTRRLILFIIYFFSVYLIIWVKILKFMKAAPKEIESEEWYSKMKAERIRREREERTREKELKQLMRSIKTELKRKIPKLLKEKAIKMPASEIDAFLDHRDVDMVKEVCEELYQNGKINRTGNYRYFILTEEKKKPKPKKASAPKSESTDIPKQIKKLRDLKDQGILTEEEFQNKKKELLDKM